MDSGEIPRLRITGTGLYCRTRHLVFPARIIIPELIPYAYEIEPETGYKDQKKDKYSVKGKTITIQSRSEVIITLCRKG